MHTAVSGYLKVRNTVNQSWKLNKVLGQVIHEFWCPVPHCVCEAMVHLLLVHH